MFILIYLCSKTYFKLRFGPELFKKNFVLNSVGDEICPADKSQITFNSIFFLV